MRGRRGWCNFGQSHQLDEQDALDEEAEAIRLQKKQADELNEDDFALPGVKPGAVAGKKAPAAVGPASKHIAPVAGLDMERIQKSVDQLTKEEKMKLVAEGARCLLCPSTGTGHGSSFAVWVWVMCRVAGAAVASEGPEGQGGGTAGAHHPRAAACEEWRPAHQRRC